MSFDALIKAVGQVGFPIAVAVYLLLFATKVMVKGLERIEKKIDQILEELAKRRA